MARVEQKSVSHCCKAYITLVTPCLICLLSLTACNQIVTKSFHPKPHPAQWIAPLPSIKAHNGKLTDLTRWWQQFKDPELLALIAAAQAVSPNIESAKARVIEAQANLVKAQSTLLPKVNAEGSASQSRSGYSFSNGTMLGGDINASWELDFWDKNKNNKNEQAAKLDGTTALWHEARVIVAAETAKQYIHYRTCEKMVLVEQQNADSTAKTEQLAQLMTKAGLKAKSESSLSEGQSSEAANQLKKQLLECDILIKGLVALTAIDEPTIRKMLANHTASLPIPDGIEVSAVPAETLAQRPDVLNAERNVAAASFEIAYDEALRYPRLSLDGSVGLTYNSAARRLGGKRQVKVLNGLTWSIGPLAVSLPIFDGGTRKAVIIAAKAQYEAAKSVYEHVARDAIREVEEALLRLNSTKSREQDVKKAYNRLEIAYAGTQARYEADLANLFELEEARRARLQAQKNVVALENERVLAWIALYRALGGGWKQTNNTLPLNTPKLIMDFKMHTNTRQQSNAAAVSKQ